MSPSVADASVSPTPMASVSPGMCIFTAERFTASRLKAICHLFSVFVVSSGTVSLSAMSRLASARSTGPSATFSFLSATRLGSTFSRPTPPFTRAEGTSCAVLMFTLRKSRSVTSTLPTKSGRSRTPTMSSSAAAMVSMLLCSESLGCVARSPCTLRSSGKLRRTRSTDTFMPVDSEAYPAACLTAQFCTGGM